jgi:hypothetical protein
VTGIVLERRTAATAAVVFGVLALALVRLPPALHTVDEDTARLASLSPDDRPLIGAFSTDIDRTFLREAKHLLPPTATYALVSGPGVRVSSQSTLDALAPYTAYWLMPRVQVADPIQAQWVLSFGGDLKRFGLRYRRVVAVSPGIAVAELAR